MDIRESIRQIVIAEQKYVIGIVNIFDQPAESLPRRFLCSIERIEPIPEEHRSFAVPRVRQQLEESRDVFMNVGHN